jgi:hypothetical protein
MSEKRIVPNKDGDFNIMQERLRTVANVNVSTWAPDSIGLTSIFNSAATLWDTKYAIPSDNC